ncbi:Vesicle-associated membrane protein 1 [Aix galericulata]|nr:Vesicle-associated membrane protein 1 [Aix galericulata]
MGQQHVVDIMRVNVDKVLERDEKLSELDDRADALQAGASVFESSAAKLKRKYWWKNCKMMIMMGVICAIMVVVIVTSTVKRCGALSPDASSWKAALSWLFGGGSGGECRCRERNQRKDRIKHTRRIAPWMVVLLQKNWKSSW